MIVVSGGVRARRPIVMAKPRNKLADYLVYLAARLAATFLQMAPLPATYRAARFVGNALHRLDRRHRDRAVRHLQLSFPHLPAAEHDRLAAASMRSMCYLGVEVLLTTRLITRAGWRRYIRLADQEENLRLLLRRRGGMVYVTGHFGNWEVVGYTMAALGFANYAVARPLDNPYLDRYVRGVRENRGMVILDKKGASRRLDPLLDAGEAVSFIADQDAGRKGLFVDFFGRPASTYKAPALMAMRHEAPIVVGYGRRIGETFRFELGVQRIIRPEEWRDRNDPLRWITQEYTRALEDAIRRAPEQYLWVHRRWKHRPRGEQQPEDGVA